METIAHRFSIFAVLLAASLVVGCAPTLSQSTGPDSGVRASLLRDTEVAIAAAREASIPLLSPDNFRTAERYYARAEEKIRRGRSIESIREDIAEANRALNAGTEIAELARVTFARALKDRDAALAASASTLAFDQWSEAERVFERAARQLEAGDVNDATEYSREARQLYQQSELTSIQGAILNEARKLITEAEEQRAERYAPLTLGKARRLVARAETDLARDRYATAGPLTMAREAEYEARHAAYLAAQAARVRNGEISVEELILDWEQPLAAIADALDSSEDLSTGYEISRDASLARIQDLRAKAVELELATARVVELEAALGMTEARAKASEQRRAQVQALERLFSREEARILQEGDNVVIRLVGLGFDSGEAVIRSEYFRLLRKIEGVPGVFPCANLVVEGHTDSVGNDTMNLALSERRANSVRDYLVANTILPASQIQAVGYGETRPIANNETAQGRALNRRTDVVVAIQAP